MDIKGVSFRNRFYLTVEGDMLYTGNDLYLTGWSVGKGAFL
jgi:hypothetical protein